MEARTRWLTAHPPSGAGPATATEDLLLEVRDLKTWFKLDEGTVKALDGASFDVKRGKTLCIVGESGCGKSMTARSILQIVRPAGQGRSRARCSSTGSIPPWPASEVDGRPCHAVDPKGELIRGIRGKEIAMISRSR